MAIFNTNSKLGWLKLSLRSAFIGSATILAFITCDGTFGKFAQALALYLIVSILLLVILSLPIGVLVVLLAVVMDKSRNGKGPKQRWCQFHVPARNGFELRIDH